MVLVGYVPMIASVHWDKYVYKMEVVVDVQMAQPMHQLVMYVQQVKVWEMASVELTDEVDDDQQQIIVQIEISLTATTIESVEVLHNILLHQ